MNHGKISTILITIVTSIIGVAVSQPDLLEHFLSNIGCYSYLPGVMILLIGLYNYLYPRYGVDEDE